MGLRVEYPQGFKRQVQYLVADLYRWGPYPVQDAADFGLWGPLVAEAPARVGIVRLGSPSIPWGGSAGPATLPV